MTGPAPAIRLLHLEDSEPDHALAMAYLQRGGIHAEPLRIESRAEFAAAHAAAMPGLYLDALNQNHSVY